MGTAGPTLSESTRVKVNEAYRDYTPPFDVAAAVRRMLRIVPQEYLGGLDCVVLVNAAGLPRRERIGKLPYKKRRVKKATVLGLYHHKSSNSPAYIELRVDNMARYFRGPVRFIPLLRDLFISQVFFHELGHHIHHTVRPQHAEKEDVAEDWGRKLGRQYFRQVYWYVFPLLVLTSNALGLLRCRCRK